MDETNPRKRREWLKTPPLYVLILCVLVLCAIFLVKVAHRSYVRPLPLSSPTLIYLPKGAGHHKLLRLLEQKGLLKGRFLPQVWLYLINPNLKYGEYQLPPNATLKEVVELIVQGAQYKRLITLPEGITSAEVCRILESSPGLEGKCPEALLEGSLLPNTYATHLGDEIPQLLARWQSEAKTAQDEVWERRDPSLSLASPQELITLASIVEKETAVPHERPVVSAVFHNRLKAGMRLQADPTVLYGIHRFHNPKQLNISKTDLRMDATKNPYNTYKIQGLPPTPICHPGIESLRAAANPAPVSFLFFVADGTGGHIFSNTLGTHRHHHSKWRALRTKANFSPSKKAKKK